MTGMGFVSGTVAKAAGEAAAWAALDYLVAGEVDYERLARNLVINVVVDLGTVVLTGEAWEKPRQRTIEGDSHAEERIYEPSPKHNPQGGWGSENPIPNNEVGQELLDNAYSSSKNKQLYSMYEGDIIKFQPDSSSGKWHAYKVSNTAKEVPTDVYKKMLDDGVISKTDYNKLIKNNWY